MKTRLVHYRFLLCAVVICGLLAGLTLSSSETHAFDLNGIGNLGAPGLIAPDVGSVPDPTPEQDERTAVPAPRVPTLGCCDCVGQSVSLDVSTGQGNGSTDPFWQVNGGPAYITPPVSSWVTLPQAKWLQPVASPTPSSNIPAGVYKYTLKFSVAKCTIPITGYQLTGKFAADNSAIVRLDGGQIFQCTGSYCFQNGTALTFNLPLSAGSHILEFDVTNDGSYSGLLVNAQIKGQCTKQNHLP
jgi:hypothetical protein